MCYGTETTPSCNSTNKTTTFYIKSFQERIYHVALTSNINKTWDFASKEFISNKVVPLVNYWEPTTGFSNWKIDNDTWLIATKGPNGSIVYYVSAQSYTDSVNSGCKFVNNCA